MRLPRKRTVGHSTSYVEPALDQLRVDKKVITTEGLNTILEAGRAGRAAYYKQRIHFFRGDQIRRLTQSVAETAPGEPVEYKDIVSSLMTEYESREAKQLFHHFLEKGILAKCGLGYAVPIPSMHTWLVDEFART